MTGNGPTLSYQRLALDQIAQPVQNAFRLVKATSRDDNASLAQPTSSMRLKMPKSQKMIIGVTALVGTCDITLVKAEFARDGSGQKTAAEPPGKNWL